MSRTMTMDAIEHEIRTGGWKNMVWKSPRGAHDDVEEIIGFSTHCWPLYAVKESDKVIASAWVKEGF
jgi:hypothetical protein